MVIQIQPTIPFFQGSGYDDIWSTKMKTLFISEDLWELVDKGYVEEEISIDAISEIRKKDAKALFFIQQAIAESIFPQISKATKSKQAWDALQIAYQSITKVAAQDGDGGQTDIRVMVDSLYKVNDAELLNINSGSNLNQDAAQDGDGNQTDITTMDDSMYEAAAEGYIEELKKISESEFQVQLSPKHNTILHIASEFGQKECVEWILELPSCLSLLQQPNLNRDTPLHLAAREGHLEVVKALIKVAKTLPLDIETGIGTDKVMLRMENKGKDTALHEAVRYGHSNVVELLIKEDPEFTYGANDSGTTPLYMAAERGFANVVKIIIDKSMETGTSPPYTGFMGRTALHAAVISNDQEMTKKILEWKSDLTKQVDEKGWSPLHCAAEKCYYPEIVSELLQKDRSAAYLETKDGNKTALHIAALHHRKEIVEEILSHSPGCREQVDDKGNNVFHFAMMKKGDNDYNIDSYLENEWLKSRGLVNEKDAQGNTPLHLLSCYQIWDCHFLWRDELDKKAYNNEKLTAYDIIKGAKEDISGKKDLLRQEFELAMPDTSHWAYEKVIERCKKVRESKEYREKYTAELQKQGTTHLIVSALITTVTFAAGFTLPGGYKDNDGKAILTKKAAFGAFVVTDAIAMMSSLCAVFLHFFMTMRKEETFLERNLLWAFALTMVGMGAMTIAFTTGLYVVLPHSSALSIFTCILCSCFFLSLVVEYRLFWRGAISYMVHKTISALKKEEEWRIASLFYA